LLRAISMDYDFDEWIDLLREHGLQCTEDPVDYYVLDAGLGYAEEPDLGVRFLTRDDGELQYFVYEDRRYFARMREKEEGQ
jgi:hypothetical protein